MAEKFASLQKPDVSLALKKADENKRTRLALNNDIKTSNFPHLSLLYGPERYLIRYYKNAFKKAIIGDDEMNYTYFSADNFDMGGFIDTCNTMPFFAEKRLVIVECADLFSSANEELEKFFESVPEFTYIIFIEDSADKRLKVFKSFSKIGQSFELYYQSPAELQKWIFALLKKFELNVTKEACDLLIDRIGIDMNLLEQEIKKLISYCSDKGFVDSNDVKTLTSFRLEDKIFDMIDFAVSGNKDKAFDAYRDILQLGEAPIKILINTGYKCEQLIAIRDALDKGYSDNEIMKKIGISSGALYYTKQTARKKPLSHFINALKKVNELDGLIKSGNMNDRLAVEILLTTLTK